MKLSVFHISESASHYIYVDKLDFLLNSGSISPSTRCVRRASQLQESLAARARCCGPANSTSLRLPGGGRGTWMAA